MIAATRRPEGRNPAWSDERVWDVFGAAGGADPDGLALVDGDTTLSWGEAVGVAGRLRDGLTRLSVGAGDVVTVQLPNWWETVVLMQAVMANGSVVNPVVPIYREAELRFILAQAQPAAVVVPHRFRGFDYADMMRRLCEELPSARRPTVVVVRPDAGAGSPLPDGFITFDELCGATAVTQGSLDGGRGSLLSPAEPAGVPRDAVGSPDDVVLLLYTSGTTAAPKGALHPHRTLLYECRSIADLFDLGTDDRVFMASPLTHITGFLYGVILPSLLGTACALLDVWNEARAADLIEAYGCRFTCSATPFLTGLVAEYTERGHPSALAHFACGGADVPPDLVRRATDVLAADVVRVYGSTEFPTYSCGRPGDSLDDKAETDGYPIGPVQHRIEGDGPYGELLVRGPELFWGYLDGSLNVDSFTVDGFFRTGDLARAGPTGSITIVGRAKDIIIRKGENISAREVEDLLYGHPAVTDVAVVAVPNTDLGEMAYAVVVPTPGTTLTLRDLGDYLDTCQVAKQKHPEGLVLVEALPRTASGKVQKYVLREQLTSGALG